ncbi:RT_RNaseH_2 domain-containing protein [Trichonephila clavata]|uniref:RT_RNaseH_2 domain-containing protein n=1 Tax=Trichonephila clavata TaxID=2740835 RepID=A0A8X6HBD8_TRICU|nr:RT_RNaseH_2 domain-containing protein [Trichonephila clavata]
MAFLGKGLKADLQIMATEMGVEDVLSLKVFELREAILNTTNFDEEFCREQLNTIIEERKRREEMDLAGRKRKEDIEFTERKRKEEIDLAERKRKEDIEFSERKRKEEMEMAERKRLGELKERKRKDEMNFELQKKRIELEGGGSEKEVKESGQFKIDLHKLMPKFDSKSDDISLFLTPEHKSLWVRAELVKYIECTGEGKIKLISAFGDSEVAPLRTFNIKIDDGWHDAIPKTFAVSKKLVNDMLVCQTTYEALLESIQLCSVNERQVIDVGVQMDEVKDSTVCKVLTCEENSYSDIEMSTDAVNIENEVRSNLSSETRIDHVGITFYQDTDFGELHYAPTDKENQPNIDIELNQMPDVLNTQQKYQLRNLLQRYEDIFRNRPGKARVKGHSVKVTADSSPKRLQPTEFLLLFKKKLNVKYQ